jgi:hypothetical protein
MSSRVRFSVPFIAALLAVVAGVAATWSPLGAQP